MVKIIDLFDDLNEWNVIIIQDKYQKSEAVSIFLKLAFRLIL